MNTIANTFIKKSPLFIPFMMAGYPSLESSLNIFFTFVEAGADIIEIGVPFSDPVADGPVIQKAAETALKNGTTLQHCIKLVKQIRATGCETPIILFSYFNPILAMGVEEFTDSAKAAGINGILIVDLPPEEGEELYQTFTNNALEIVLLASPTTDPKRFNLIQKLKPSFIYYISRCGVTGVQNQLAPGLESELQALRLNCPDIPVAVGFGISSPLQAYDVAKFADAVVVGSLFVKIFSRPSLRGESSTRSNPDLIKSSFI